MSKDTIVVDIDGTVAEVGDRIKHILGRKKDWDAFYESSFEDEPICEIIQLVKLLSEKYHICFCTGRRESVRQITLVWILKHFGRDFKSFTLLMRKDGDFRHDLIVKPELLVESSVGLDRVVFILEDRSSMVDKWRRLGFRCLQVDEAEF